MTDYRVDTEYKDQPLGTLALDALAKGDPKQDAFETGAEIDKEYKGEMEKCIKHHKKLFGDDVDFYVVVLEKRERHLTNVIRRYFFGRQTIPSPQYDQTVWYYRHKSKDVQYLWTLPNKQACKAIMKDPKCLPAEFDWLKQMVWRFYKGTLIPEEVKQQYIDKTPKTLDSGIMKTIQEAYQD